MLFGRELSENVDNLHYVALSKIWKDTSRKTVITTKFKDSFIQQPLRKMSLAF